MTMQSPERNLSSDLQYVEECEICGGSSFEIVGEKDRHGAPLQTVLCDRCGLVFSNPRPTAAANEQFYRESYRLEYKRTSRPSIKHLYRAGKIASERLVYIQPFLPEHGSILDMGSGGGELLYMLRSNGHEVQGIEPNIGYAEFARESLGLPVITSAYQAANIAPGSLDFITSFHVFEHLDHPLDALRYMVSWLKPEGCIFIEVPNILSSCQWPHSRFHRAHQYHFSTTTLSLLGTRLGLKTLSQFTSRDSGNAMIAFRKTQASIIDTPVEDRVHAGLVKSHLQKHTWLRHTCSVHPYARPLTRFWRKLSERRAVDSHQSPQAILASLAAEAANTLHSPERAFTRLSASGHQGTWRKSTKGVYAPTAIGQ